MARIEEIVGEGPELSDSQKRVLELMEAHSGWLFRMHNDDLVKIQAWLASPDEPEPPQEVPPVSGTNIPSLGTIRWAISTLRARDKIGGIVIHRRTYYGSHDAIRQAGEAMSRSRRANRGRDLGPRRRTAS